MVKIAVIGDYDSGRPSHIKTSNALEDSAGALSLDMHTDWLPTRYFKDAGKLLRLQNYDGIWGAPGVPESSGGFINAIAFSRKNLIPYLGT